MCVTTAARDPAPRGEWTWVIGPFAMLLGVGGVMLYRAVRDHFSDAARLTRTLAQVPVTPIGDVEPGRVVRVVGTVEPHEETLTAPLCRRTCVYWNVQVEEQHKPGVGGPFVPLAHGIEHRPFVLRDATGHLVVEPTNILASVPDAPPRWKITPELEAFLTRCGVPPAPRTLAYTEVVLEPGKRVSVVGLATGREGAGALRVVDMPDGALLLSSAPTGG